MTPLTAATLKREVLDPAMDAIALNSRQGRWIANATAELDCIVDGLNAIAANAHDPSRVLDLVTETLGYATRALATGQLEDQPLRRVSGFADRTARSLRGAELNRTSPRGVPARAIADGLRSPLEAFSEFEDRLTVAQVALAIQLITSVPSDQLLAPAVRYQLGKAKSRLLERLIAAFNDGGARAGSSDAASQAEDRSLDGQAEV